MSALSGSREPRQSSLSRPVGFDPERDSTQLLISDADRSLAFLELDDLSLGRFARSYLIEAERAFHSFAGDKEMPYSLIASMHGALALIRIAAEANAGSYELTQERVTIAAQPMGDWKITIKQTKAPAIAAGSREGHDSEAWRGAKQARAAIAQPSNPNEDGL